MCYEYRMPMRLGGKCMVIIMIIMKGCDALGIGFGSLSIMIATIIILDTHY